MQHGVSQGASRKRWVPVDTVAYLLVAGTVGVGAHHVPDVATPVSLALVTFLTLDRVTRQIR
ncbi:hypothetical protein DDE19_25820 [Micromonospora ureilytica]|uniref:Uncharacterized protein n=1 Tax=Micromonospora ureilytica TaxID=709868 RepID=A0A3N9XJW4_9ACTN|nr:hypothetical protein DDE19_25820 [Micromonospora ureilytica]